MFETSPAGTGRNPTRLEAGAQVEGTVLAISGGLVILDVGTSADATIDAVEFDGREVKVGDKIRATVANPRSDGPQLTLSLGRGGSAVNAATLQLALEGGTPVSGTVSASNKGGFTVDVAGVKAFCPISQIDVSYVNTPEIYVGQTFDFQVVEIKEGGRNVVVSRRKLLQDARRVSEDAVAAQLTPGGIIEGTVKSTVRHGAIVDLGGVEGFIPMAELSRGRTERAEDVVTIGERVQVKILTVERGEKGLSIRLSLKALEGPGEQKAAPAKDEILSGKVIKHVPNGVIVSTEKGEGLVPTRELALAPGADHRRSYPVDTELRVVVASRDPGSGKMRLSVTRVAQVEELNNYREFSAGEPTSAGGHASLGSLGVLMSKKFPALAAEAKKAKSAEPAQAKVGAAQKPVQAATQASLQPPSVEAERAQKSVAGEPKNEIGSVKRRQK